MNPSARRILITMLVTLAAAGVVIVTMVAKPRTVPPASAETAAPVSDAAGTGAGAQEAGPAADTAGAGPAEASAEKPAGEEPARAGEPETPAPAEFASLRAVAPPGGVSGHDVAPQPLGALDPRDAKALVEFSRAGAGISRITSSEFWETASDRRRAEAHYRAIERGETPVPPLPPDEDRYVLQETQQVTSELYAAPFDLPLLAAARLGVNGVWVDLFDYTRDEAGDLVYVWAETGAGVFETTIVDGDGTPVLHVTRRYRLGAEYDLTIEQRVRNLTDRPVSVTWQQWGPCGLRPDRARYMDRRRCRFGYLPDPARHPARDLVLAEDNDLLLERPKLLKRWKKAVEARSAGDVEATDAYLSLWPNQASVKKSYELSWFGTTNRYFTLTIHPPIRDGSVAGDLELAPSVSSIREVMSTPDSNQQNWALFTYMSGDEVAVPAGGGLALDLGVYAGPLDSHVLDDPALPYRALSMQHLVLYQMSSMCAICTFQWLAGLLLGFLEVLHSYVVFDWGLAIIGLVIVVRLALHPITKRSQVSMQRFSKAMSEMKPELDKLQKKFPNDSKKIQQEQMRLMRERGVNPLQMLGCLPMFLQTPIWIALYAMLYFAFDLRQEPAFFGLFQTLTGGHWPFLADLSAADHALGELSAPTRFLLWNVTGINILPILMGVIFFVQQKYMSPPPSPTMTEDQLKQQKIMKVLMVVMFPLMLYSAPSGLTLYILTSSTIGILESRYIRRHITEMDLRPPKPKKKRTRVKPRDAQGRAYAAAMDRMAEKRRMRQRGPVKKYKKRRD